jgi:hypothetical protein
MGYEDDCGGFGDVILDVAAGKITVERNDRFEDYTAKVGKFQCVTSANNM